jgi:hypothetical protein
MLTTSYDNEAAAHWLLLVLTIAAGVTLFEPSKQRFVQIILGLMIVLQMYHIYSCALKHVKDSGKSMQNTKR